MRKLNGASLEVALTGYFDPQGVGAVPARGSQAIALDGKCQKGRHKFEAVQAGIPVDLLSLFCQQNGLVLAQTEIVAGKSELSTAPPLIRQIEWAGRVLTGDAAFCYKEVIEVLVAAGGDYFLAVKANQPTLQAEIELVFDTSLIPKGLAFDRRYYQQADKGHGRIEVRYLCATVELAALSAWPYLAQVVAIKREWLVKGQLKTATSYCVTSLPPDVTDVIGLLTLKRRHWAIENQLHWVRDVVLGEDSSLIHKGNAPRVMAALRNTTLNLLRKAGFSKIKASLRALACDVSNLLTLLGCSALALWRNPGIMGLNRAGVIPSPLN